MILSDLRKARSELLEARQQLEERFHGVARSNGHVTPGGDLERLMRETEEARSRITTALRELTDLGCELKDADRGMVDFRTLRDGRVVYLCWLMDEPRIMFWHELDAGFRGRQPLD